MLLSFIDFIAIIEIALALFASSFALLLPLYAYLKNLNLSLKVCIPLSLSAEILIGYAFYSLGQIKIFPLAYLLLILSTNIFFAFRLKLFKQIKKIKIKLDWRVAIPVLLIIASVIFSRFYDALLNIAPGAIDAAAHAQYVLDIGLYGRLSCTYYAPGFHILIYPISQIVEMVDIYRFAGPVLGVITMLSLYLLFKDFFKNKISLYFLILAFGLPIFNILTAQTISFFSTIVTFILLPMLFYVITKPKGLPIRRVLTFYIITLFALALSVPYLLVQLIPAIIFLNIIVLVTIKKLDREYLAFISKIFVISILGFILAFGHVYLQSAISKKNNAHSFPQIAIAESQDSGFAPSTNLEKTSDFLEDHSWMPARVKNSAIVKNYLFPMIMTGSDVILVKEIRPLNTIVSIFAYLWIIISLAMIYLGIRRKKNILLALGSFILVFGTATQTGILEMSTYRGRSGWYLLLFVLISSIYFLDTVIKKIPRSVTYALFVILLIASFIKPPVFYRPYFLEYFSQAKEITHQFPNQKILLITDKWRVAVVSKNFSYSQLKPNFVEDTCEYDQCFIILEKKFFEVDPILSQKLIVIGRDLNDFKINQAIQKKAQEESIEAIKNSPNFSKYKIYWEDENLSIYKFEK